MPSGISRLTRFSNQTIVVSCVAFFFSMVGLAYASVPLYQLFCQITGFGGTTQVAEAASDTVLDRTINVRFDANMTPGLPWRFQPVQRQVTVKIGEIAEVAYEAESLSALSTTGTASFNVTPPAAGAYFNKMECFCFTEQTLEPGEVANMPITFFVDPAIVDAKETRNLETITLSYTFYPVDEPTEVAANAGDTTR